VKEAVDRRGVKGKLKRRKVEMERKNRDDNVDKKKTTNGEKERCGWREKRGGWSS